MTQIYERSKMHIQKMKTLKYVIYAILFLSSLPGCAKRGMLVKCGKGDYERFLEVYKPLTDIDSFKGNGNFTITAKDNELFGKFSILYSKEPQKWTMTLFGLFGMVLSEIVIENDSIIILSSLLDQPYKNSLKNSKLETYTGIYIDPELIPLLTTGRIPNPRSSSSSSCIAKNENIQNFIFEDNARKVSFEWDKTEKKANHYISELKNGKYHLEVKFADYRNINLLLLPHSIVFVSKGKNTAYLKLKYDYIELSTE